jgi:hypothetical protein
MWKAPKILSVSISAPFKLFGIRTFVDRFLPSGVLTLAELPEEWSADSFAFYEQNPVRATRDELKEMARREWPWDIDRMEMSVVEIGPPYFGFVCVVKPRRRPH